MIDCHPQSPLITAAILPAVEQAVLSESEEVDRQPITPLIWDAFSNEDQGSEGQKEEEKIREITRSGRLLPSDVTSVHTVLGQVGFATKRGESNSRSELRSVTSRAHLTSPLSLVSPQVKLGEMVARDLFEDDSGAGGLVSILRTISGGINLFLNDFEKVFSER